MTRGRMLAIGALVVLTLAAAPLLGWWVLGVAALLLLVLVTSPGTGHVAPRAALVLGVLGGLVGSASATAALRDLAADPIYGTRAGFGWAALALALVATAGGTLSAARPKLAAALLVGGSTLGFVAINLFSINTFYFVAPPVCWLAAALALAQRRQGRDGPG